MSLFPNIGYGVSRLTMLLGNLHPAHQNQEMQGDVLAWIRPNQGLAVPTFGLSDGEDLAGGANYPYGPPAVPATMVMVGRAGNEGLHMPYYHLDLQTSPQSNRLVRSERPPASSTEAGEAAFSSCLYGCCPFTSLDVSLAGPAAQAVAPQMNTVTPYVGYGNDGGGSPVGAGVCAALPAPRPTRKTMEGASRTPFTSGRSDAGRRHRSPHRALGYDQTSRRVPIRRAMRRSQSGAARGPAVQFEADVHVLATRLLKEGADHIAVKLLCDEIFNNEVSAKALMVKSMFREHSTGISMRSKYRLLLERVDGSKGYCCLLCPQSHRKEYKNPPDSIRHFCKAHFGIVLTCISGWYVGVSQGETQ